MNEDDEAVKEIMGFDTLVAFTDDTMFPNGWLLCKRLTMKTLCLKSRCNRTGVYFVGNDCFDYFWPLARKKGLKKGRKS
jgi:hypothetical protein